MSDQQTRFSWLRRPFANDRVQIVVGWLVMAAWAGVTAYGLYQPRPWGKAAAGYSAALMTCFWWTALH